MSPCHEKKHSFLFRLCEYTQPDTHTPLAPAVCYTHTHRTCTQRASSMLRIASICVAVCAVRALSTDCVRVRATEGARVKGNYLLCPFGTRRCTATTGQVVARTCTQSDLHNLHKSKICVCFTNRRFVCKLTQI